MPRRAPRQWRPCKYLNLNPSEVDLVFMDTPFRVEVSLTRWSKTLHFMIHKLSKSFVNKLRIVQLYEADFNTMLKNLMGRRLIRHSEEYGINGYQLYGSRKGKSTYDALITVWVIYNMT